MANGFYLKGMLHFAQGDIQWKSGGNTFKAVLGDAADYTVNLTTDEFLSSISAPGRVATGTISTTTAADDGILDGADVVLATVSGDPSEWIVIYNDTPATEATKQLLIYIDTATGLPVSPNGGDITIVWDNTTNKIAKI